MILTFTTLNAQAQTQDFTCWLDSLELGLDALSSIAAQGNQLIKVALIDEHTSTPVLIPIEVFDGQMLSEPLKQLELQWKLILSKPIRYNRLVSELSHRRIQRHITNIAKFKQAVDLAEQRLRRSEKAMSQEPYRTLILRQLTKTLERCQHVLVTEQASLQDYIKIIIIPVT